SLILGKIVGLVAEIFTESGHFPSRFILNDDAITSGTRIASRATVTVRNQIVRRRILAVFEERFGSGNAGRGHDSSVQRGLSTFARRTAEGGRPTRIRQRPAARRVARRGGRFAAKMRSCASFR